MKEHVDYNFFSATCLYARCNYIQLNLLENVTNFGETQTQDEKKEEEKTTTTMKNKGKSCFSTLFSFSSPSSNQLHFSIWLIIIRYKARQKRNQWETNASIVSFVHTYAYSFTIDSCNFYFLNIFWQYTMWTTTNTIM